MILLRGLSGPGRMLIAWALWGALLTGVFSRQLQQAQDGASVISTEAELKVAILQGASNLFFTQNITLTEQMFPEPPATCLKNNPGAAEFRACARRTVFYDVEEGATDRKATWRSAPNVVLDVSFLYRGIVLNRPIDLVQMELAQIVDDQNPFFFLFGTITDDPVTYRDCTMYSPCGGKGWRHIVQVLSAAFPLATVLAPNTQTIPNGFKYDAIMRFPIVGPSSAQLVILSTTILCYDTPSPYAQRSPPGLWLPGSESSAVREADACQRPETLGADYRGTQDTAADGTECQLWSAQEPQNHTTTPQRFPEFGLASHNYCRNPDRSEQGVWCYLAGRAGSGAKQRAFCSVPFCPPEVSIAPGDDDGQEGDSGGVGSLSMGAFWGIMGSIIAAVVAGIALACYCCKHRMVCHEPPVKEHERDLAQRHELEHPRTDVTVALGASSALGDGASGGMGPKIGAMHDPGAQTPAERLEEELRRTMSDAGGESQLQWKEKIGEGAHGHVYRGVWKTLRVAIKSIKFHGADGSSALEDYATSALSCVHANLIKTFQCFRSALPSEALDAPRAEVLDLVHEYCEGGNISNAVNAGFFLTPDNRAHSNNVLQVVWEMSVGLNYLHSKGAVHGDLNPRNVLLKGQKSSTAGGPSMPSQAEANADHELRAVYSNLAKGFVVKITDFGLALRVRQTGAELAAPAPGAQFYIAPEALEFGSYTQAADVFSFGALLWEMYHSQPPYRKTKPGFFIRPHSFPKFEEGASLPYAALTVACLHPDPNLRPTMDKVVMILQDVLMGAGVRSPSVSMVAGSADDGNTLVSDLTRNTLGEDCEDYRCSPTWRGVLEELNGITSSHILDMLTKNKLEDIINLPAPSKALPRSNHSRRGTNGDVGALDPAALGSIGSQGPAEANARAAARPRRSSGRSPAGAAAERAIGSDAAGWEEALLAGADDVGEGAVVDATEGPDGDAAKVTMLLHGTLDNAAELGHQRARSGSVTSEEESEMFEDAKDELFSDESFFTGGANHPDKGHRVPQQRRARPLPAVAAQARSRTGGADPLAVDIHAMHAGNMSVHSPRPVSNTSMDSHFIRVTGAVTPPGTGDLVSSRSNVSMVSDWDQVEMVKDEVTGQTRFNVQRVFGRGGSKARSVTATGDGLSHGPHLGSAHLNSTMSGVDSNPGTPIVSQTLDAVMGAGEHGAVGGSTPGASGAVTSSVNGVVSGSVAAAAGLATTTMRSSRAGSSAAALASGSGKLPTSDGGAGGTAGGGNSDMLHAHALLAEVSPVQGPSEAPAATDVATGLEEPPLANDVDEESQMDVLRWAPAQRAQTQAANLRRGLEGGPSPSQVTLSHPTSAGSNSSVSSMGNAASNHSRVHRIGTRPGNVRGLTSSDLDVVKSAENIGPTDSHMHASLSSIGARSSFAHSTFDRVQGVISGPRSADFANAAVDARAGGAGVGRGDSPITSGAGTRNTSRMPSGPLSSDTGVSVNVPPLHAGRAAASHLNRGALTSGDGAIAVPNIIVKGRAARSFDGLKLGEFRPMAMRSERIRSHDGAQAMGRGSVPLSGSTRLSSGAQIRGPSEDGGASRGLMGLQSLFDSFNASEGDDSPHEQVGLADVMQKGLDGAATADADKEGAAQGDSANAAKSANGPSGELKGTHTRKESSGGGSAKLSAAEKAAQRAERRKKKLAAAAAAGAKNLDLDKDLDNLGLPRTQASGSDGSPLSMRDLDVSHVGSSVDTHSTPPAASFETGGAQPTSTTEPVSPAVSGTAPGAPPVASGTTPVASGASVSSGGTEGVGIDLNPKHTRGSGSATMPPGIMQRPVARSGAGSRMPSDVVRVPHSAARRNAGEGAKVPSGAPKPGKAPMKAGPKEEAGAIAGKSHNVRMYMHPLLRNNRAAIAHVEKIQLKGGPDDTSGSGERTHKGSATDSLDNPRTSSSGAQSSVVRSGSQARSHTASGSHTASAARSSNGISAERMSA